MLDLGGSFTGFIDALFGFLSSLLTGIFGYLADLFGGIDVLVS